jgi:hypothetical protein
LINLAAGHVSMRYGFKVYQAYCLYYSVGADFGRAQTMRQRLHARLVHTVLAMLRASFSLAMQM